MRLQLAASICVMLGLQASALLAGPLEEAQKLHEEAVQMLKTGSGVTMDPKQYAGCVVKLEKAMNLLDSAGQSETALAQEVNASLYWARKFTTSNIIDELQRQRGGTGDMPPATPSKTDPPKSPQPQPVQPPKAPSTPPTPPSPPAKAKTPEAAADDAAEAAAAAMADAKKKFSSAQEFANQHAGNDYAIALRWFQVADQVAGTDFSVKALALAREAQKHFAEKEGKLKAEKLPDTPAMKLVQEADAQAAAGRLEDAVSLYLASLKTEETRAGRRKLGHAYFERAQQLKDALLPEWEAAEEVWRTARREATETRRLASGSTYRKFNPYYPPYVEAERKMAALRLKAKVALKYYDQAADQFRAVLTLSGNGKDLDAAAHRALCYSVRGDPAVRTSARQYLLQVLSDYTPANDMERTLYEYCKTDLARLNR